MKDYGLETQAREPCESRVCLRTEEDSECHIAATVTDS
jgi:hypothetical protein